MDRVLRSSGENSSFQLLYSIFCVCKFWCFFSFVFSFYSFSFGLFAWCGGDCGCLLCVAVRKSCSCIHSSFTKIKHISSGKMMLFRRVNSMSLHISTNMDWWAHAGNQSIRHIPYSFELCVCVYFPCGRQHVRYVHEETLRTYFDSLSHLIVTVDGKYKRKKKKKWGKEKRREEITWRKSYFQRTNNLIWQFEISFSLSCHLVFFFLELAFAIRIDGACDGRRAAWRSGSAGMGEIAPV